MLQQGSEKPPNLIATPAVIDSMAVARHGSGLGATFGAVTSQIHPVFMLPPLAATWFGAILATGSSLGAAAIHTMAIFAAVYTAHVKDGYIDYYVRAEDDDHPLTVAGCRLCLIGATVLFGLSLIGLWVLVDWTAVALTAPTWVIGYLHAPQLDMHPIGATMGYPIGLGLSLIGGYYVQAETLTGVPIAFAIVFVLLLAGIKIVDDAQDHEYDRAIDKPTVAVLLGQRRARQVSGGLIVTSTILVVGLVVSGTFPSGALFAALALVLIVAMAWRLDPMPATALLVRGSYVFLAILIAAVWFDPM